MIIFTLNTIDNRGGAAVVAWNLRNKLRKKGHVVPFYVGVKYSNDKDIHVIPRYLGQITLERFFGNDLVFARTNYLLNNHDFLKADVVHCHNLHSSFFSLQTLMYMSQIKPVVWTLHDLWPITGGAPTRVDIEQKRVFWKMAGMIPTDDYLLHQKELLYKQLSATIVVPSQWMNVQVENSILSHIPRKIIPHGIDFDIYKPANKHAAREKLDLPLNKTIFLFSAKNGLNNRYKGGMIIRQLIPRFPDVHFVIVGAETTMFQSDIHVTYVPFIDEAQKMALYYQASDYFLYPTQADSFGLVIAEAMACGCVPITFYVDAVPELVIHNKTGYIVEKGNTTQLISESQKAIHSHDYDRLKSTGISFVKKNYSLNQMVTNYLELYQSFLERVISE